MSATAPAVKARPILFSGPMVRALLAGTKTQTRRTMKPQPVYNGESVGGDLLCHNDYLPPDALLWKQDSVVGYDAEKLCPYGQPGERLWVRETHALVPRTAFHHASSTIAHRDSPDGHNWAIYSEGWTRCVTWPWKPSIHMPRWACRIVLEITDIRVERLQAISQDDARAEGCDGFSNSMHSAVTEYAVLWDRINGFGAWDANPWVWALTFRRVTP